ncbi:MAG: hypothetical protein HFJ51_01120 [Clostridia bacterium]|nr:hypothetical protein [Clostridia bacterium]
MKVLKKKNIALIIFVSFIFIQGITLVTNASIVNSKPSEKMQELVNEQSLLTKEERETLELINIYRKERGLKELKTFAKLQEVAYMKAKDIVDNEYFSHNSKNLGTPFEMIQNNGIEYRIAGENLAGNITPEKAVEAWINSRLHRENIEEGEFEYTGICVMDSPVYGKVFVQIFLGI